MEPLLIEAGAGAFGSGDHPTTRGVLAALEAIDPALFTPRNACDIGCGSGILSFSIIKNFLCPVVSVDISVQAIDTLRFNCFNNGIVTDTYARGLPSILPVHSDGFNHPTIATHAPYDLIVMNILAEPLLRLAADADAHLASEGVLVLSGILSWQEPPLREAYASLGLELTSRLQVGDWVTLLWQKP